MTASNPPPFPDMRLELAAALDWWRDAGVDSDFSDDATAWLHAEDQSSQESAQGVSERTPNTQAGRPGLAPEPAGSTAVPRVNYFAETKPETLSEFHEFWMSAPGLDAIGPRDRTAPRGVHGAELMVLVVEPEGGDRGKLLSGPQGNLLNSFFKAAGVDPDSVYLASALTRHTPMADTQSLAQSGLDAVLLHHIALAQPKRLIGFGAGLVPLLGLNVSTKDKPLRNINHTPPIENALLSEGLDSLLDMPCLKARFWRRWIEWSALH